MTRRTLALMATMAIAPLGLASGLVAESVASAQTAPTPEPTPKAVPPKTNAPKKDAPKSLDEVLGIPSSGGKAGDDKSTLPNDAAPALDKAHDRVEKALDEKALEDLMRQALGGMRVSADRLSKETDSGLGTQRVQQDVIAKLDTLIEDAKKRCKSGDPKSGSKSGQCNSDQPKEGDGKKPGESKSKSSKDGKKPGEKPGANAGGGEPPPVDPVDQAQRFNRYACLVADGVCSGN